MYISTHTSMLVCSSLFLCYTSLWNRSLGLFCSYGTWVNLSWEEEKRGESAHVHVPGGYMDLLFPSLLSSPLLYTLPVYMYMITSTLLHIRWKIYSVLTKTEKRTSTTTVVLVLKFTGISKTWLQFLEFWNPLYYPLAYL